MKLNGEEVRRIGSQKSLKPPFKSTKPGSGCVDFVTYISDRAVRQHQVVADDGVDSKTILVGLDGDGL